MLLILRVLLLNSTCIDICTNVMSKIVKRSDFKIIFKGAVHPKMTFLSKRKLYFERMLAIKLLTVVIWREKKT